MSTMQEGDIHARVLSWQGLRKEEVIRKSACPDCWNSIVLEKLPVDSHGYFFVEVSRKRAFTCSVRDAMKRACAEVGLMDESTGDTGPTGLAGPIGQTGVTGCAGNAAPRYKLHKPKKVRRHMAKQGQGKGFYAPFVQKKRGDG